MMLEDEDYAPHCVVLRTEPVYHEYDKWSGDGPNDKMIRPATKKIYLAELIGKEMLNLPVFANDTYECGKVRITIEPIEDDE